MTGFAFAKAQVGGVLIFLMFTVMLAFVLVELLVA
jgi:flagellin-like protein